MSQESDTAELMPTPQEMRFIRLILTNQSTAPKVSLNLILPSLSRYLMHISNVLLTSQIDWRSFAKEAGFSNAKCANTRWSQIRKRLGLNSPGTATTPRRRPATTPPPRFHGNMGSSEADDSPTPLARKHGLCKGAKVQKTTGLTPAMRKTTTRRVRFEPFPCSDSDDELALFKSEPIFETEHQTYASDL
ncbi:MAG: hypothetical protein M1818_002381 [Claussenomyces sp. TS43310]|nr:MAG: hypothetical protein M1818_002381 [Claussenomyces sp. TS43310]